jgi:hypothetical protein
MHQQTLLTSHDVAVFQHPLYWYSVPPLLKQWMDLVLEHGWAYGSTGRALEGKMLQVATTAGGRAGAYGPDGLNRFTFEECLRPIEATARLCRMSYQAPCLTAAVIAVPIAKRLGLGSVLGYLIASVVIGPSVLGFVGAEGQDVMHATEFGVVMMLFVIGLELEPALLWRLRRALIGLGGAQVLLTGGAITLAAPVVGLDWRPALAIGLTLALSSTAIVPQTLQEKGWMRAKDRSRS